MAYSTNHPGTQGARYAEVTLRLTYFPEGEDHPGNWAYGELLDLPSPAYVAVVAARSVQGMEPTLDPDPEDDQ